MQTLVLYPSAIAKYAIAKILFDDSEEENYILAVGREDPKAFYDFRPLKEYAGDERLQYLQIFEEEVDKIPIKNVTNVLVDDLTQIKTAMDLRVLLNGSIKGNVVFLSSGEVYGTKSKTEIPIKEDAKLEPTSSLGQLKQLQEVYFQSFDSPWVILRLGTLYGPYLDISQEIPRMMLESCSGKKIQIKGSGSRYLDFQYVTFALPAIVKSLTSLSASRKIINIGAGKEYKVSGIARAMLSIISTKRINDFQFDESYVPPVEPKGIHCQLDIKRAQEIFKYEPSDNPIRDLVQLSRWMSKEVLEIKTVTVMRYNELTKQEEPKEITFDEYMGIFQDKGKKVGDEIRIQEEDLEKYRANRPDAVVEDGE